MLSDTEALDVANSILAASRQEDQRLDLVASYLDGTYPSSAYIPSNPSNRAAAREYAEIVARSRMPILSMVVDNMSQNLYVDGYRPERSAENAAGWAHWQANRMDARQAGVHRATVAYGAAYCVILPGKPVPVWRPVSPRRGRALYADRLNDEWPIYFMEQWTEGVRGGGQRLRWRLYDDENIYDLAGADVATATLYTPRYAGTAATELLSVTEHSTGFCPVVRWTGSADLDGQCLGEIEPLIPLQKQMDASTYYIEMAQQYAVHRQRWGTGLAIPEDDNGQPVEPFDVAINRLLVAEDPDAKFGEFGQTEIKSWLDARQGSQRAMAIKSQIPPGYMLGDIPPNLSAEAVTATESPGQRRANGYETLLGESWEQAFRLDAWQAGDEVGWMDTSAQVKWRDTTPRSLAQVADALGKLAAQLGIPARGLWEKIPGVTDQDLEAWEAMRADEMRMAADAQARSIGMVIDEAPTDASVS